MNPYICSVKKCGRCKKEKSKLDFHSNPSKKDGLQSMCKDCRKEYHKEHYNKNKEKYKNNNKIRRSFLRNFVNRHKGFCGCNICGENRFYVLDYHHKDDKEKEISSMINDTASIDKIKNEIRKCDVVCANCHRELHFLQQASNA